MSDEVWRLVPGFPLYQISSHGRVQNIVSRKYLSVRPTNRGLPRAQVVMNKKVSVIAVHRVVAELFMPGFDKNRQIGFKDRNPLNCHVDNLTMDVRYARTSGINKKDLPPGERAPVRKRSGPIIRVSRLHNCRLGSVNECMEGVW